jgi:hypothetical protein
MDSNIKTHSIIFTGTLAPGATIACQGQIENVNRQFLVKSVAWDWRCGLETVPGGNIPIEQNTTQVIELGLITIPAGTMIASPVINPTPLVNVAANGVDVIFYKPGKRNFNYWFVINQLNIVFNQTNLDVLNMVRFYTSIIIEIEDL